MSAIGILRSVPPTLWSDPAFRALSAEGKVVHAFLHTSRHCNMAGLYQMPPLYIAYEAGVPLEAVEAALVALQPWVTRDIVCDEVFLHEVTLWNCAAPVPGRVRNNGKPVEPLKDLRRRSLVRSLAESRSITLRRAWLARYGKAFMVTAADIGLEGATEAPSLAPSLAPREAPSLAPSQGPLKEQEVQVQEQVQAQGAGGQVQLQPAAAATSRNGKHKANGSTPPSAASADALVGSPDGVGSAAVNWKELLAPAAPPAEAATDPEIKRAGYKSLTVKGAH